MFMSNDCAPSSVVPKRPTTILILLVCILDEIILNNWAYAIRVTHTSKEGSNLKGPPFDGNVK